MVHFVGAGPGAPDLITRRGAALLQKADCIIYAGSLVNPALLGLAKADCAIYNSAEMTLEQVLDVMRQMELRVRSPCACTPATPACTEPSGSRWMFWMPRASPTTIPPVCPASAVQRRH
mgnify:CR=1 FL=1